MSIFFFSIFQVKYLVLLCGDDEDSEIVKAAAGSLAMLTSQSTKICKKVFDVSNFWSTIYFRGRRYFHT